METGMDVKRLSQAEVVYVERLNTAFLQAKRTLDGAIDFLREQHGAQAVDGWVMEDLSVGFVRPERTDRVEPSLHSEEIQRILKEDEGPEPEGLAKLRAELETVQNRMMQEKFEEKHRAERQAFLVDATLPGPGPRNSVDYTGTEG